MQITSRQNSTVQHLRQLSQSTGYRRECNQFLGVGSKLLTDYRAAFGEPVNLYSESELTSDLLSYISGMQSAPDCVFVGEIPEFTEIEPKRCLVLEDIQDPGNVGAIIRSAAALGSDTVILSGDCADPWQIKALRGSMGAIFRINVLRTSELFDFLDLYTLPLYSTTSHGGEDIRTLKLPERFAIAIGNEGNGLKRSTLKRSSKLVRIPISDGSESLNAAVAASIMMWETMGRNR